MENSELEKEIISDISKELQSNKSFISESIKLAIDSKAPARQVFKTLIDMADDNYKSLNTVLSHKLIYKILSYEYSI